MKDLTAMDILIEPDETALARARLANAQLRTNFPAGFELDERHRPHVTVLQRYVRSDELGAVFTAVGAVIGARDLSRLDLRAIRFAHMSVQAQPGLGLAAMVVERSPELLQLQAELIAAISPFVESGGTAAAYVTGEGETDINADTLRYVESYVPEHSGANYLAHLTVGLADLDFLKSLEEERFEAFTFRPAGMAVYQLGNNGTAQRQLKAWSWKN